MDTIYYFNSHGIRKYPEEPRVIRDIEDNNIYIVVIETGSPAQSEFIFLINRSLYYKSILLDKIKEIKKIRDIGLYNKLQKQIQFNFIKYGILYTLFQFRDSIKLILDTLDSIESLSLESILEMSKSVSSDEEYDPENISNKSTNRNKANSPFQRNSTHKKYSYDIIYCIKNDILKNLFIFCQTKSTYNDNRILFLSLLYDELKLSSVIDGYLSQDNMNEYKKLVKSGSIDIKIYLPFFSTLPPIYFSKTSLSFYNKLQDSNVYEYDVTISGLHKYTSGLLPDFSKLELVNDKKTFTKLVTFMYNQSIFPTEAEIQSKLKDKLKSDKDINKLPSNSYSMSEFLQELKKRKINNNIVIINCCNIYTETLSDEVITRGRSNSLTARTSDYEKIMIRDNIIKEEIQRQIQADSKSKLGRMSNQNRIEYVRKELLKSPTKIEYQGQLYSPSLFANNVEDYNNIRKELLNKYLYTKYTNIIKSLRKK